MASYQQLYDYYTQNVVDPNMPKGDAWNNAFNQWTTDVQDALGISGQGWDAIPADQLSSLAYEGDPGTPGTPAQPGATVPLEQGLLQTALPGLLADVGNDAQRQLMAQALDAQAAGDYQTARDLIARATSGQQLQTELGTADQTAASKQAALQQALDQLTGAQAPVSAARTQAAQDAITGVNLGLEGTKDQLTAERAAQGYVGGSTMDDAALARATIGARQQGATLLGDANLQNATDTRSIGTFGANQGYSIAGSLADQRQALTNADYGRSLQAALSLPQLQNSYTTTLVNNDALGNAGLTRTQNALNWWAAPATAPTSQYIAQQPSNSGNQISALGTNLLGAGISIGNANNWWQTPNNNNTPALSASPTGYTTPNGNVGVQTDWSNVWQ
jgi:hypothetical protein